MTSSKTILITGATSGIGKVAASVLAQQGHQVIVHGRSPQKTAQTVEQIKNQSGNPQVSSLLADFNDLEQVRGMAAEFIRNYPRLDVLINNAGAFFNTRQETPYSVERTFVVNHLAPFTLTNCLIEILKASAPARIVTVSSDGHQYGDIDFDDLQFRRGYFGMKAYARSKLANILFSYELARRLEGSGVCSNALHPGHVATDIWRTNFPIVGPLLKWVTSLYALTPEQGAETLIYLASSPEVEGQSGKYYDKCQAVPSSAQSYDLELAQRLWELSEQLTAD